MNDTTSTEKLLRSHFNAYPKLQAEDIFKFLFQSVFGCEHMISSQAHAVSYLQKEAQNADFCNAAKIERLDGNYSRVPLAYLGKGLNSTTLGKLFYLSASAPKGTVEQLESRLDIAERLITQRKIPLSIDDFKAACDRWKAEGYPALHHSDAFREAYHPSYRVISNKYVPYVELLVMLDKMLKCGNVKLAIEGSSASGKTTLATLLEQIYDCTVFHMDDFFLRPEQRTKERFAQPGGNIDKERFLDEVLLPISRGESVNYRRFDCSTFTLTAPISVTPKRLTVIEGAYSMHPELSEYYDLSVFLNISPEIQKKRIGHRNSPQMAQRFFDEWIPMELKYFNAFDIKSKCDVIIDVTE